MQNPQQVLTLTANQVTFVKGMIGRFREAFQHSFMEPIEEGLSIPFSVMNTTIRPFEKLKAFEQKVAMVYQEITTDPRTEVAASVFPALKRVLINERRVLADQLEDVKERTPNPEILNMLEEQLAPYDALVQQPWFLQTDALPMPRILDYLTLERVNDRFGNQIVWHERKYDEKFRILLAPELFLKDLDYYRRCCDMRGLCVAVAFLDIDEFKKFNTAYTESYVDRHVLPRFMRTLEAHFFFHGHGYRYGGDEYAVILPNATRESASNLLRGFQNRLTGTNYDNVKERLSVSIGMCIGDAACFLTNRELLDKATKAKKLAKENGKNCLAAFDDATFDDDRISIVRD